MTSPYWHGQEPFVYFPKIEVPWRPQGATSYNGANFAHRSIFMPNFVKAIAEWHFIGTALVKEGPKALVLYRTPETR